MSLRHVLEHLRQQHWTAIFLDLVIVVVGVFIGMQVSNWNEERATRQRALVFSERLRADLRVEAWAYAYQYAYNRDVLANAKRALDALGGDHALSDEQLVISAYRASQFRAFTAHRATYDELVSTGTIGLIADAHLREIALITYVDPLVRGIAEDGTRSEYRLLFRRTVSADVQHALLKNCGDRDAPLLDYARVVGSIDYACTLDLPAEKVTQAAAALRGRDQLVPALQLRFADIETALSNLVADKDYLEALGTIAGPEDAMRLKAVFRAEP
jgi:hypothetical protein